jgi:hypothetical protein
MIYECAVYDATVEVAPAENATEGIVRHFQRAHDPSWIEE